MHDYAITALNDLQGMEFLFLITSDLVLLLTNIGFAFQL